MATYTEWNKAIYEFYDSRNKNEDTFSFCITEEDVEKIGSEKLNIKENILSDFCECITSKIIIKGNQFYSIKFDYIEDDINNHLEKCTAIVAFFILVASTIEKESKSYWYNFRKILDNTKIVKKNDFRPNLQNNFCQASDRENFKNLFDNFAKYISKKHNINFEFPTVYKRSNKHKDLVGLPLSQAMITASDEYSLYDLFNKFRQKILENRNSNLNIFKYIKNNCQNKTGFSCVFKLFLDNNDYSKLLEYRLSEIYNKWEDLGCQTAEEYKNPSQYITWYRGFYHNQDDNSYHFGITTKLLDDKEYITFECNGIEYTLKKGRSNKYYNLNEDFYNNNKYIFGDYKINVNGNFKKIRNLSNNKEWIHFKLDESTNNWIETITVRENDEFSSVLSKKFYENEFEYYDKYEDYITLITLEYDEEHNKFMGADCLIKAIADSYDGEFKFIQPNCGDKIFFQKGLKIDNKTYVYGAGPVIVLREDVSSISLTDENENKIFKYEDLDLNDKKTNLNVITLANGNYRLFYDNLSKPQRSFSIDEISNVSPSPQNFSIYNYINPDQKEINKCSNNTDLTKYICGADIEGYDILSFDEEKSEKNTKDIDILSNPLLNAERETQNIEIVENIKIQTVANKIVTYTEEELKLKKIRYIFEIIKLLNKSTHNIIPPNLIKSKLEKLNQCEDINLVNEINDYFNKNFYYNNLTNIYLNKLSEVL